MRDLRDLPATDENIIRLLGHPTITVNPGERELQCTNCGRSGHSRQDCRLPDMDALLERFGTDRDEPSPAAVTAKKKIVTELYAGI